MSSPSVLERLRHDTREAHRSIELLLEPSGKGFTMATYVRRLELFYGFYEPVERALAAPPAPAFGGPLTALLVPRAKAHWLADDLVRLQAVPIDRLPLCSHFPDLQAAASRWGCAYVLEGATLGGQLISRQLHQTLGLGPDNGARFFNGYGAETGSMWRYFRDGLETAAETEDHDRITEAARATFQALHRWCQQGLPR